MKVYICGDTHIPSHMGKLRQKDWPEQENLSKEDILIVLGDFGLLWDADWTRKEKRWARWLALKNCTVCFIDGNHENHDRLAKLDTQEKWGGTVGVAYSDKNGTIYHLRRGEIYMFDSYKVFTMGGASSNDKENRLTFQTWWPEEVPSMADEMRAMYNLEKHNYKVDYILTHTCPDEIAHIIDRWYTSADPTRAFFDYINDKIAFNKWFFGHWHEDQSYGDKFRCLYNSPPLRII